MSEEGGSSLSGLVPGDTVDLTADPAELERLAGQASITDAPVGAGGEALVLSLHDLLPDVDGAVVMLTDASVPVNLVSDEALAESGVVADHLTAGGVDVAGLHFYVFESGLTLYSDTDVVIVEHTAAG